MGAPADLVPAARLDAVLVAPAGVVPAAAEVGEEIAAAVCLAETLRTTAII